MSFTDLTVDPSWSSELLCQPARAFLHGVVGCADAGAGWQRPQRFLSEQESALGSCLAWHPGLYRQMSRTSAGVCLEFTTDSTEIALELRTPGLARSVRELVAGVLDVASEHFDGIACEVDGELLPLSWGVPLPAAPGEQPRQTSRTAPRASAFAERIVSFDLAGVDAEGQGKTLPIPGLGCTHHVRLWLPCLHEVELRNVWGDGTFMDAVPARPVLLVLGDGSAQGIAVGDAASVWCARVAESSGFDLLNQGLVRQVFQPSALAGLGTLGNVGAVVVELGSAYRSERCRLRDVERDVRSYLSRVVKLWPQVAIYIVTPYTDPQIPPCAGSCFDEVVVLIEALAKELGAISIPQTKLSTFRIETPRA